MASGQKSQDTFLSTAIKKVALDKCIQIEVERTEKTIAEFVCLF